MDANLTELLAQYGILGSLLFIMLYWLVKHYLPEHQRQHREDLLRILDTHERNTIRMVSALDRNTKVLQLNSQALLVAGFTQHGLERAEAEAIVRRMQAAVQDAGAVVPEA